MREDLNSLIRRTRIISGSILFFYAATHLLNHSLATFSIAAADAARWSLPGHDGRHSDESRAEMISRQPHVLNF